jgi:hypothetical protein
MSRRMSDSFVAVSACSSDLGGYPHSRPMFGGTWPHGVEVVMHGERRRLRFRTTFVSRGATTGECLSSSRTIQRLVRTIDDIGAGRRAAPTRNPRHE